MKLWFVVRTKSGAEGRAAWHLKNQGFEVYLPRYRKQIRHARRTQSVLRPLFIGYLFVHLDLNQDRWRSINGTFGVISLVPNGSTPQPITDDMVDLIRAREDKNGAVSLRPQGLKKGDQVRVREGGLADHIAFLDEVCDQKRVILLLAFMGREVRVMVPLENLARVS